MKLGERLREIRQQHEKTLLQLAQATALSVSYLSDLERGRTNPSIETLEKIASTYQMTLGDLVASVDGWQTTPHEELPAGLAELVDTGEIDLAAARDLSRVELRGKRPQTATEWHLLYLHLKTLMRPYLTEDDGKDNRQ